LWAALRRRSAAAGLFLALAASLKVIPVFLVPLLVRLGRWRAALSATALLGGLTVVTMAAAPGSWQFFTVVLPRIGLGNSNWDNASIDGLVSRFVALFPTAFGVFTVQVGEAVVATAALAVLGLTFWRSGLGGDQAWQLRLGTAATVTALLMVSSVTWQHHLVTLLLPLAVGMAWIAERRPDPRYSWTLALSYALCWIDRRALPRPPYPALHPSAAAHQVGTASSTRSWGRQCGEASTPTQEAPASSGSGSVRLASPKARTASMAPPRTASAAGVWRLAGRTAASRPAQLSLSRTG